ncbi:Receptor like protein 33 [Hibiscus syriacus]|uniref:Receptor like protein 33 n=1 Tax=Hibiscus syriacus TaxID=106335 RepID=A0A6A3BEL5_HIBSY|nr:receptor-like protein 9DC3 [Hibiscus syriacus]KAE8714527.1 Receptor like protein 33 [Hibiscus syriacus]
MGPELARTLLIFTAIDFSSNGFHGKIPEAIGELCAIQMLNLSHNSFTGHIPQSLGNLVQLESLDHLSNKLSGRIPSQLTNLTFLEVLIFSQNNLVGPIPYEKQFNTFETDSYQGNLGLCGFPLTKQCGSGEGPEQPAKMIREDDGGSRKAFFGDL